MARRNPRGRRPPPEPTTRLAATPSRVRTPPIPKEPLAPEPGRWLWTCRAGFEAQLYEELAWRRAHARILGEALLESNALTGDPPTFARMGFRVAAVVSAPTEANAALPTSPVKVQVWVPDTDRGNARGGQATAWEATLTSLRRDLGDLDTPWKAFEAGASLAQVCLFDSGRAAVGCVRAREAISLAAGGRARMKKASNSPSRSAMKLDEAFEWYGVAPGSGDLCVDLGSAPGGWTRRLVERGARVWSVDPAKLAPELAAHRRVKHFQGNAFEFEPGEAVDWLCCDMAWRPLEVAQLLGKWGRRGWARQLVANLKLPMQDKMPTVARVRSVLEEAGWKHVRIRQLYHDRDEVTVTARHA